MPTVTFHGARGSCPCSGPELSRYGGATACVSVDPGDGRPPVVFDLGTGSRGLGEDLVARLLPKAATIGAPPEPVDRSDRPGHLLALACLLTHLHFDHVQGLPFFLPALREEVRLDIYAPPQGTPGLEEVLSSFICPPYFPVRLSELPAELFLHEVEDGSRIELGDGLEVLARQLPHLGPTLGYRLEAPGCVVAYLSDHQAPRVRRGGAIPEAALELAAGADLLIHDAQYTSEEFTSKAHWGHSTISYAVEVAGAAGAKRLALFHHDPTHDDTLLDRLGEEATALAAGAFDVVVAAEGGSLLLDG